MSYFFKNLQPGNEVDEGSEDDELLRTLSKRNIQDEDNDSETDDDGLSNLSFDALRKAEAQLENELRGEKKRGLSSSKRTSIQAVPQAAETKDKYYDEESFDENSASSSDGEGLFEEESVRRTDSLNHTKTKKKSHAPAEQSAKKRASRIRQIPGLEIPKSKNENLYQDIRFDKSMAKSDDYGNIRKHYSFLDEYRQNEINELTSLLKDRKFLKKITDHEKNEMEERLTSMKSKLQTLQNRDLDRKIIKDYETDLNKGNKTKFHLKKSEQRKVIQKYKFDHMKAKQREKVMDRKRKKRLGKEFKQFSFHDR
ncbi:LADA_0C05248g1_1 [Lachancea dasiensis]|uniref:rRNA biogenesis protein RRP36 n=1 Tax=Lachancea dasiensis TaxID=1072105 RepID=A0A1G4IZK8_9SACH|nr:LADA_0C05248g1_1 [Lachancea dasiensis]